MNKEEAIEELQRIKNEVIPNLEKLIKNEPKKELRLDVSCDCMFFCYGEVEIGYINHEGKLKVLSSGPWLERYNQWCEDGMHTNHDTVEWCGGKYRISDTFTLERIDGHFGLVYNFKYARPTTDCEDTNIIRTKHTKTPVIF